MTSQNQNQFNDSENSPKPYGGGEGLQQTERFTQGQQGRNTDEGTFQERYGGGEGVQQPTDRPTYGQEKRSLGEDTFRGRDDPTSQPSEEYSSAGNQSKEQFPGAASGAAWGGRPTESSVPGSATSDSQRGGTEEQYGQSKLGQDNGTQAGAAAGGTAASGTAGTKTQGTGSKVKEVVSSVQGAGEALRGKVMEGFDEVFGNEQGAEKNREIAQAGMEKMKASGLGGSQRTAPAARRDEGAGPQAGDAGLKETRY